MTKERLPVGSLVYFVQSDVIGILFFVASTYDYRHYQENKLFETGNYFATRADAEKVRDRIIKIFEDGPEEKRD